MLKEYEQLLIKAKADRDHWLKKWQDYTMSDDVEAYRDLWLKSFAVEALRYMEGLQAGYKLITGHEYEFEHTTRKVD